MDPLIVLFGLGVGLLVGTTGVGGGSVMTPVLILAFGVNPVLAVGTDLAYGAITKTVGGLQHLRQGTVSLRIALWLAVGSIPGALGGVVLLDWLHDTYGDNVDSVVMAAVAAAVLFTACVMFARTLFVPQAVDRERDQVDPFAAKDKIAAVVMGLSVVLSSRLPAAGLRLALGAVLLAASLGLLTKAGLAIPPGLIVVIPIVGLSAWLYARRGRRAPPRLASPSSAR
jgi:uncharacterized protein